MRHACGTGFLGCRVACVRRVCLSKSWRSLNLGRCSGYNLGVLGVLWCVAECSWSCWGGLDFLKCCWPRVLLVDGPGRTLSPLVPLVCRGVVPGAAEQFRFLGVLRGCMFLGCWSGLGFLMCFGNVLGLLKRSRLLGVLRGCSWGLLAVLVLGWM